MVIDTVGVSGVPVVSLSVAGRTVTDPAVTSTRELEGLVVEAAVDEVPDSYRVLIRLTVPEVHCGRRAGHLRQPRVNSHMTAPQEV